MARIGIFGAGYVGLVTGACFAELGHDVILRDVVPERVERLRAGEVPIYEPGLEDVVARNRERISFTLDVHEAVDGAEFLYVAVGTPPTYSGDADLSYVWSVVDELPEDMPGRPLLVMKSYPETLLDQTCRMVVKRQMRYGSDRGVPWGISESAYNLVDRYDNYQYKAFGVPGLGLKRGLGDELVVSPYATALAAMLDPTRLGSAKLVVPLPP